MGLIDTGLNFIFDALGANAEADARNAQIEATYKQDLKEWKWVNRENKRNWNWEKKRNQWQREDIEAEYSWRDQSALQDWRYQLAIADVQDRTNAAAYKKSLETYGLQRSFNNMAAASAYASEQRKLQDAVTDISFKNQDVTIQALEAMGNAQARGVSGRSAGKAVNAVIAQAGRNQAILAESLASAQGNFRQANDKIATDKFGADLNAWGNLMVRPEKSARPEAPLTAPRPRILDPRRPRKTVRPAKGVKASATAGYLRAAGSAVKGVADSFDITTNSFSAFG